MPRSINLTLIFFAGCLVVSGSSAQVPAPTKPIFVNGSNNETAKANIALLAQSADEGDLIILIARLGDRETSNGLSRRRLRNVRDYLPVNPGLNRMPIPDKNIITATGDRASGKGRIEAYLRGKLFMIFVFERNMGFAPEP
jgi:hypothetical protein